MRELKRSKSEPVEEEPDLYETLSKDEHARLMGMMDDLEDEDENDVVDEDGMNGSSNLFVGREVTLGLDGRPRLPLRVPWG